MDRSTQALVTVFDKVRAYAGHTFCLGRRMGDKQPGGFNGRSEQNVKICEALGDVDLYDLVLAARGLSDDTDTWTGTIDGTWTNVVKDPISEVFSGMIPAGKARDDCAYRFTWHPRNPEGYEMLTVQPRYVGNSD